VFANHNRTGQSWRLNGLPIVLQSIVEHGIEASWEQDVTVMEQGVHLHPSLAAL
jgi:hypothetical protein